MKTLGLLFVLVGLVVAYDLGFKGLSIADLQKDIATWTQRPSSPPAGV